MYLDAASKAKETVVITETNSNGFQQTSDVFEKWKDWYPSQISHHGKMCCEIAREWLTSQDFSESGGSSLLTGPRWLRQRFNWGASSFPIYWCEAVRKKTLDCGALAAFAHEVFMARGVKSYRIQLVQKFSEVATNQWTSSWNESDGLPLRWIDNDLIYHEGCAIAVGDGKIKVWDASAGWWINANSGDGYGSLTAIRLSAESGRTFEWETHRLVANQWQKIN
jgi:hypothetical protein